PLTAGGIAGIRRTEARRVRAAHDVVAPQRAHGRSKTNADVDTASGNPIRRQNVRDERGEGRDLSSFTIESESKPRASSPWLFFFSPEIYAYRHSIRAAA